MRLEPVYKNAFGYTGFIASLFAAGFVCGVFILYICRHVSKVVKGAAIEKPSEEMHEYITKTSHTQTVCLNLENPRI